MRVLVLAEVDPRNPTSGAERVLSSQVVGLVERGHEVLVLSRADGDNLQPSGRACALPVRYLPRPRGRGPAALAATIMAARRAVNEELGRNHYDLLFIHQPMVGLGAVTARGARRIPIAYNYHSPWSEEHRIRSLESRRPLSDPNSTKQTYSESLQSAVRRSIERRAVRRADRVIFLSRYMASLCQRMHGIPDRNIAIIPGGVDIDRFRPSSDRAKARARICVRPEQSMLLTVRGLESRMGLENLIEAMVQVRRERENAVCIIGGTGPLEKPLKLRAQELSLNGTVRFAGFIPEVDLADYYASADLFVLPTTALEGFGLVSVEALSCGTPVVGTPVGGTPEILGGLDKGLVMKDATPAGIADGILRNLPRAREDIGWRQECRDYAVTNFSWPMVIDRVERELLSLVESRSC
jgi:glycosyltransferase involved in cell wall biosynthesis